MQNSSGLYKKGGQKIAFIRVPWSSYISDDNLSPPTSGLSRHEIEVPHLPQNEDRNEIFYSFSTNA